MNQEKSYATGFNLSFHDISLAFESYQLHNLNFLKNFNLEELGEENTDFYREAIENNSDIIHRRVRALNKFEGLHFYLRLFDDFLVGPEGLTEGTTGNPLERAIFEVLKRNQPFVTQFKTVVKPSFSSFPSPEMATLVSSAIKIDKKTVGCIALVVPENVPVESYLLISDLLAVMFSDFIESAVLSYLLLKKTEKIDYLKKKAICAQEDERKLIAFDIHDIISQRAAAIFYRLQAIEHLFRCKNLDEVEKDLSELSKMAKVMVDDITRLIFDLKPPHIEELGIEASLRRYIDQYKRECGIKVDLHIEGSLDILCSDIKLTAYRIVQEALANIRKHARVNSALTTLKVEGDKLFGEIIDEGVGFDQGKIRDQKCLGVLSMKERALLAGGTFKLESQVGKGTRISFCLPVSNIKKIKEGLEA